MKVTVKKESPKQSLPKITSETAVCRCSSKEVLLEISQYSQENICVGIYFWESCRTSSLQLYFNLIPKETWTQAFSCKYYKIFTNIFFSRTLLVTAFLIFINCQGLFKKFTAYVCYNKKGQERSIKGHNYTLIFANWFNP